MHIEYSVLQNLDGQVRVHFRGVEEDRERLAQPKGAGLHVDVEPVQAFKRFLLRLDRGGLEVVHAVVFLLVGRLRRLVVVVGPLLLSAPPPASAAAPPLVPLALELLAQVVKLLFEDGEFFLRQHEADEEKNHGKDGHHNGEDRSCRIGVVVVVAGIALVAPVLPPVIRLLALGAEGARVADFAPERVDHGFFALQALVLGTEPGFREGAVRSRARPNAVVRDAVGVVRVELVREHAAARRELAARHGHAAHALNDVRFPVFIELAFGIERVGPC